MSSYIVEYITMDRVASCMAMKRKIKVFEGDELTKEFKKLIKQLWDMNVEALAQRYGEQEYKNNKEYVDNYKYTEQILPRLHFEKDIKLLMKYFKSFCNYTYQCSEGNVPKTKLYKEVDDMEKELACDIATSLPEWDDGKWE